MAFAKKQAQPEPPTLTERINALQAQLDTLIDHHAEELKKAYPGIPIGVLRLDLMKHQNCQCRIAKRLLEPK